MSAHKRFFRPWELVTCPVCHHPAVADLGGDHSGTCGPTAAKARGQAVALASNGSGSNREALRIIREYAELHEFVSANDVRSALTQLALSPASFGALFTQAQRQGWLEKVGTVPSDLPSTNSHDVKLYRSLLYRQGAA